MSSAPRIAVLSVLAALAAGLAVMGPGSPAQASGVDGTSPIRTIAGSGTAGFSGDGGAATSARLNYPSNLAVDAAGNVYVVDNGNNRIRKVATDGTITTVAGTGVGGFSGDGGPATSAQISNPYSIAVGEAGTIFIGDDGNNRIRKVDAQGTITTYAGTGTGGFSGDGGPATLAKLRVASMAIDAAGTVYFTDQGNGYVRKITPNGIITTIAGNGTSGYSGDGGPGTSARIRSPYGVGVDAAGNVYFAEISNHVIRRVTPQGIISTYAGTGVAGSTGDGGQATLARLSTPGGMAVDASGNVFFNQFGTNQVRKVAPDGIISTVAGTGTAGYSGDGGPSTSARLNDTEGLAIDAAGNLYLADSSNHVVRRVDGPVAPDTTPPTVTLSAPAGPVGSAFTVTATFSEDVTGLTAGDFTVTNGTVTDLAGSGAAYTVTITPAADGTISVDLPAGSATDTAGNTNTAATRLTRTADLTRPTVTLSAPTGPVNGPFTVTATFSEIITGLAASDFVAGNGTAGDLAGSGTTYTVTLTPAADGAVSVDLPGGSATDAAGNTNTAATQLARTADLTRPTVTLSAPTGPVNASFTVTATFSETVTGLTAGDFTVANGAASSLTGSGATYTVTITPATTGQVMVDLPAGSANDSAGNTNTAATQLARTADLTRPTVALSAPAGSVTGPFTVTATFSESVTGLAATAFTVGNGTPGNLTGSGTTYSVTITPTTTGQVTVDLPAGSATDGVGNTNTAAAQLTRTVVQPTFAVGPDATITGTPVVGGTLTAHTGTTAPAAESVTYAWAADGTPIAGAGAATLTLDAAQLGKTITVTVTATRTGYDDAIDTSTATAPVGAGTFGTGPTAAVTGTARVGQTLTAATGAPVPTPDSNGYLWYADDVAIAGQTGPQLTLTSALAGRRIRVEVTARRAGYADAVSQSTATDPVAVDQAPQLTLDVTVAKSAGQATDGTTSVRRRTEVTIAWSASADATVTATGELGAVLARRYPNGPVPTSGQVTVKLKRSGLHPFRMEATGPGGTTSAYEAVTVVRAPTRLRVEAPAVARSGKKVALRVTGLGGHERYTITLTRSGSRRPLVRNVTGRANRAGVIHRRLVVPALASGKQRITVTVTGRTSRRIGSVTMRLR